jgi:hypothetical protein
MNREAINNCIAFVFKEYEWYFTGTTEQYMLLLSFLRSIVFIKHPHLLTLLLEL